MGQQWALAAALARLDGDALPIVHDREGTAPDPRRSPRLRYLALNDPWNRGDLASAPGRVSASVSRAIVSERISGSRGYTQVPEKPGGPAGHRPSTFNQGSRVRVPDGSPRTTSAHGRP